MSAEWRYFAKYGIPRGRVEPSGLYRTRSVDGIDIDEAFTRAGTWKPTKGLVAWRLQMEEQEFVELSGREAEDLSAELLSRPHRSQGAAPPGRGLVEHARQVAEEAHRGQFDKAGKPYITHPARVAARCQGDAAAEAVAWLHDVVEDCEVTVEDLRRRGFPPDVVTAVELLTRTPTVEPATYYARIRANALATKVKLADLADNSDPERLALLDEATRTRLAAKYAVAYEALGEGRR